MKLARFNEGRIGVVVDDAHLVDVSAVAGVDLQQWPPVAATSLVARFAQLRPQIEQVLGDLPRIPLASVKLLTPIPWPIFERYDWLYSYDANTVAL